MHSKRFTEYQRDNWHGQYQNTQKINYMGFSFKVDANYTLIFKQEIFGTLLLQNIHFSYHLPVLLPESRQHPLRGCALSAHLCGLMGPNCSVQETLQPLVAFHWNESKQKECGKAGSNLSPVGSLVFYTGHMSLAKALRIQTLV